MIEKIILIAARHRFMTVFIVAVFAIWGGRSLSQIPIDAIPDLSDTQVIVFTEWMGRSPDIVEAQITYPIVSQLLATPGVTRVRGQSMFGMSFIYLVFQDDTDLYWARSRVSESLQTLSKNLPNGVRPTIGSDATAVGWVFQYALVDESGHQSLADLTALQDWTLRFALSAIPGVSEVARIGGAVREYQVDIDPNRLLAHKISLSNIIMAIRMSNQDVGGGTLEIAGHEFAVRGFGRLSGITDMEKIPVGLSESGTPITLKEVAQIQMGPAPRRGIAEWQGKGETVGGIVMIRPGQNVVDAISKIKARIAEITPSLPKGVRLEITYDRSNLILDAIDTLKKTLIEEMVIVALVIFVFLGHFRSALIPLIGLPIAVVIAFIPMGAMGLTANIMSLSGIAVAIGAMVDATIIMVENANKRVSEQVATPESRENIILAALCEVGPSIFFALLMITVSFLPVFSLEAQEGKLFKPLAYTKTFSMAAAAILAITLTPALCVWLCRGAIPKEETIGLNRILRKGYEPVVRWVLRHPKTVVLIAAIITISALPLFGKLGSEFMPALNEGVILYMPTAAPGIGSTEAANVIHILDRQLKTIPEVVTVFGKIGRAETPTDAAPLWMAEVVVTLKPQAQWERIPRSKDKNEKSFLSWLNGLRPDSRPLQWNELIAKMDKVVGVPGMPNIWWMPIQTRTEMLATGIRSPVGIKIFGQNTNQIEQTAIQIEQVLKKMPETSSAVADRLGGGNFYDIAINRESAARYALTTGEINEVIETAIGGMPVTEITEGRARYGVRVRYAREFREEPDSLRHVLVTTKTGAQIPLTQVAQFNMKSGPPMLLSEGGQLVGLVFIDPGKTPVADYVALAKQAIADQVTLPTGMRLEWAGQFTYYERANQRLMWVVPITLVCVIFLLYLNTRSAIATGIILLAVPFSLVGAACFLYLSGYHLSVAVWVGLIALIGLDAETGAIMLLYLNLSYRDYIQNGSPNGLAGLNEAIVEGAARRIRPKMMTVVVILAGLLPIFWADGSGADTMRRIAAPMVGGIVTSLLLELLVYPALFLIWKKPAGIIRSYD
ncbi:MAG: CusA/CzcA family heavy metal efflux RND transporter [Nitrospirota bacterium]